MRFFCILFILLFATISVADESKTRGPIEPLKKERLSSEISLTDKCKKVNIIEWQSISNLNEKDKGFQIKEIDKICNKSIKLLIKRFDIKSTVLFFQSISLLNFDSNYRSLNDSDYRFYYRTKSYIDGHVVPIYGYQQPSIEHIYIFNQIIVDEKINKTFQKNWRMNFFMHLFISIK